ncbi:1942_t:CDS:2, partial [Entrophospora sp. SA101]
MNNNLPVLENLKIRQPDLYGNEWTCISCKQENETQQHFMYNNKDHMGAVLGKHG